jgi:hypothetical protein
MIDPATHVTGKIFTRGGRITMGTPTISDLIGHRKRRGEHRALHQHDAVCRVQSGPGALLLSAVFACTSPDTTPIRVAPTQIPGKYTLAEKGRTDIIELMPDNTLVRTAERGGHRWAQRGRWRSEEVLVLGKSRPNSVVSFVQVLPTCKPGSTPFDDSDQETPLCDYQQTALFCSNRWFTFLCFTDTPRGPQFYRRQ